MVLATGGDGRGGTLGFSFLKKPLVLPSAVAVAAAANSASAFFSRRKKMSRRAKNLIDGKGAYRIAKKIYSTYENRK